MARRVKSVDEPFLRLDLSSETKHDCCNDLTRNLPTQQKTELEDHCRRVRCLGLCFIVAGLGVWIGGVGHHLVEDDAPESECILLRILLRGSGDAYHFRAFDSVLFLIIQTA